MVRIRQIQAREGAALRDIRLRAIGDAPGAFAVSLADTIKQSDAAWAEWAASGAAGHTRILYVAETDERWVGIAGGHLDTFEQGIVAQLISMWVDPKCRGQSLGRQLVEHIAGWARHHKAIRLEAWVTEDNAAAIALYLRCGFKTTGERQPLPSNPTLTEQKMQRDL